MFSSHKMCPSVLKNNLKDVLMKSRVQKRPSSIVKKKYLNWACHSSGSNQDAGVPLFRSPPPNSNVQGRRIRLGLIASDLLERGLLETNVPGCVHLGGRASQVGSTGSSHGGQSEMKGLAGARVLIIDL